MPIAFFDQTENTPGALASRLATDAQIVNGLTSTVVGIQVANISSLITGLSVSFVYSWALTLVSLATIPIMMIGGQLQTKFVLGFSE